MEHKALEEPQGVPFFSIKTGETHYCKLEPTIAAYINSSDMGINASRGQDYGWKLGAEWVKRIRDFKRNQTQVSILTAKNGGQKPTTVQILYYLYAEELAAYYESQEEFDSPYADQYQKDISTRETAPEVKPEEGPADGNGKDAPVADDIADVIDTAVVESQEDTKSAKQKQK